MRQHHLSFLLTIWILAGCESRLPKPITRSFSGAGIATVVVRAAEIQSATVTTDAPTSTIEVSGLPTGGADGYHPRDPNWRETPADRWGLDFVAQRYGDVLVVSTKSEIGYIHHRYVLDSLRIRVAPGVEVIRQQRELGRSGEPDLSAP